MVIGFVYMHVKIIGLFSWKDLITQGLVPVVAYLGEMGDAYVGCGCAPLLIFSALFLSVKCPFLPIIPF